MFFSDEAAEQKLAGYENLNKERKTRDWGIGLGTVEPKWRSGRPEKPPRASAPEKYRTGSQGSKTGHIFRGSVRERE